jgi:hypothetical protein
MAQFLYKSKSVLLRIFSSKITLKTMKLMKTAFLFLMLSASGLLLRSCLNDPYIKEDYLIKVDSIHIPDPVTLNIPFDVEFFGTVGYNGCHSFKTFSQTVNNNDITIYAWGTYENTNGICPAVMVYLEGEKLNMTVKVAGTYNLIIGEPDNSTFMRQITVN